jgi:predicted ATPase
MLSFGACRIMPTTGDFAAAEQIIGRLIEPATRINAPFWQTAGRFLSGKLMIERGEVARGVGMLNGAFAICHRTGSRISYPEFQGALATGLAGSGRLNEAYAAVNEGLNDAVRGEHGFDLYFAELLRARAKFCCDADPLQEPDRSYREALHVAQEQEALFWELRAALSLARVHVAQGRGDEARRLVAPVYDSFTEGLRRPTYGPPAACSIGCLHHLVHRLIATGRAI